MRDVNVVVVTGRIVTQPKLVFLGTNNIPKCNTRLAMTGRMDKTIFIDVDIWGQRAVAAEKLLKKGSRVSLTCRLDFDEWTSQLDGMKKSKIYLATDDFQFAPYTGATTQKTAPTESPEPAEPPTSHTVDNDNNETEVEF